MQGLRYLTVSELENLITGLRLEIVHLKDRLKVDRAFISSMGMDDEPHVETIDEQRLRLADEMLRQAEDEILERTLLGAKNDGGCSD